MAEQHSLLRRQLRRHLSEGVEDVLPAIGDFLRAVDSAYRSFDADRLLLERSLELSSRELLQANLEMRSMLQAFPDIIFRVSSEGVILDCRGGCQETSLLPPERLVGRRIQDVPDPEAGRQFDEAVRNASGQRRQVDVDYRLQINGKTRHYEARVLPMPEGQLFIIVRDVTARRGAEEALRESEQRLRQAQKMEAVGRLAGGIAHDFNNMLTAIKGYATLLADELPSNSNGGQDLDQIRGAADRAARLTRQLLAFSRKQILRPQVLNVNEAVTQLSRMLSSLIGEHITLVLELDPADLSVRVDPSQFDQVIMNLVVNARDAMPSGGTLTVATRRDGSGETAGMVALSIRDTGQGMDSETLAHVFEPFYTTKAGVQSGTGLGLSTVYGIVSQSGGTVKVESAPGRGSEFVVLLPACPGREPIPPNAGAIPVRHGEGTVLVVEDEAAVRSLVSRVVRGFGYSVLEAPSGEEGLSIYGREPEAVDAVISDIIMPGMSGQQFWSRVHRIRAVPFIFLTGYTDDISLRQGRLPPGSALMQKPFDSAELAARLAAVVESDRPMADSR